MLVYIFACEASYGGLHGMYDEDVAAEAAFRQMWEQIHETITDANFKEKVKSRYDPRIDKLTNL